MIHAIKIIAMMDKYREFSNEYMSIDIETVQLKDIRETSYFLHMGGTLHRFRKFNDLERYFECKLISIKKKQSIS